MSKAASIIAGEVVASGNRTASLVATRILDRLALAGFAVTQSSHGEALQALRALDAILDFSNDAAEITAFATHIGIEDASGLIEACAAVRGVLDAPAIAEAAVPTFNADALRAAYRLGHDRGTYDAGGDPAAVDADSPAFRFGEAHDLKAYLGSDGSDAAFDAFIATQGTRAPASA